MVLALGGDIHFEVILKEEKLIKQFDGEGTLKLVLVLFHRLRQHVGGGGGGSADGAAGKQTVCAGMCGFDLCLASLVCSRLI